MTYLSAFQLNYVLGGIVKKDDLNMGKFKLNLT